MRSVTSGPSALAFCAVACLPGAAGGGSGFTGNSEAAPTTSVVLASASARLSTETRLIVSSDRPDCPAGTEMVTDGSADSGTAHTPGATKWPSDSEVAWGNPLILMKLWLGRGPVVFNCKDRGTSLPASTSRTWTTSSVGPCFCARRTAPCSPGAAGRRGSPAAVSPGCRLSAGGKGNRKDSG